jgi:hypothetical protein
LLDAKVLAARSGSLRSRRRQSRLCYEFGEWCRQRQVDVLEARNQVRQATPALPVLGMLRGYFRIVRHWNRRRQRSRKSCTLDPSFAADVPLL